MSQSLFIATRTVYALPDETIKIATDSAARASTAFCNTVMRVFPVRLFIGNVGEGKKEEERRRKEKKEGDDRNLTNQLTGNRLRVFPATNSNGNRDPKTYPTPLARVHGNILDKMMPREKKKKAETKEKRAEQSAS
jgi:hypothetical protein